MPKLEAQIGGGGGFCFMGLVLLNSDKMVPIPVIRIELKGLTLGVT